MELFSGTGSFSRAARRLARRRGLDLLALDIHPKYNPTHCVDILRWDYKKALAEFLPRHRRPGDIVWVHASPPAAPTATPALGRDRVTLWRQTPSWSDLSESCTTPIRVSGRWKTQKGTLDLLLQVWPRLPEGHEHMDKCPC